ESGEVLMSYYYILRGKEVVPCGDVLEWGEWFQTAERHVAKTQVGPLTVSTVFLGLNHQFFGGAPLLFETMIFGSHAGDEYDESYQDRYSTWDEAVEGHATAVAVAEVQVAAARKMVE